MIASLEAKFPKVLAWLRQPTTILGIASLAGIVAGACTGEVTLLQAFPLAVTAAMAVALPDNAAAGVAATKAATDALLLAHSQTRATAIRNLSMDALDAAAAVPGAPVAALQAAAVVAGAGVLAPIAEPVVAAVENPTKQTVADATKAVLEAVTATVPSKPAA